MKILITGVRGLLGRSLSETLKSRQHEIVGVSREAPAFDVAWRALDLTHQAETFQVISKENPDLVIHTAAFNNVDECERNPVLAYTQNSVATRNVALACQRFDTVLMHISTDYVFQGDDCPVKGYREFDDPTPASVYAKSKYWGEQLVHQLLNRFYIVRTSWLFGPARPTFVEQVIRTAREKANFKTASDMVSTPTSAVDLAEALGFLAEQNAYGIYHLTNGGECSRWDYVQEILKCAKVPMPRSFKRVTRKNLNLPAHRPKRSTLHNLHWESQKFKPLRDWKESLREHLQ